MSTPTLDPEELAELAAAGLRDAGVNVEADTRTPLYEVTDGHKDGKRRVRNPDGGFPIVMLDGETAEQAVERFKRKRAENIASGAGKKAKAKQREQARAKAGKSSIEDKLPPAKERPGGDPAPRVVQEPSAASISTITDLQLKEAWEEICTLPGVYFGMPVHDHTLDRPVKLNPSDPSSPERMMPGFRPRCTYCRDHFFTAGAPMADELLKMGEANPAVKRWLIRGYHVYAAISGGTVVAMYLGKPIMHHLGPESATNSIAQMAGPFMAVKAPDGTVLHAAMPPRPHHDRLRPPGPPRQGRFKRRPRPQHGAPDAPAAQGAETGATAQTV